MNNIETFIRVKKGSIPIIISVPHGGTIELEKIPKRNNGVLGIDKYTIGLAHELVSIMKQKSREIFSSLKSPSYVMSKIHRSHLDLNREESEAFDPNSKLAKKLYDHYHQKLEKLIYYNISNFKKSILIDLHGFEQHKRPTGFREVDIVLGTNNLTSLFPHDVKLRERDKNFRGDLIKKFIKLNIPIAPGHPRRREYILTGGYITQKYGASNIVGSQSIQIELSDKIRVFDKELKKQVLDTMAEIFLNAVI
ncbi:MAG: hypothetical protein EU539_00860 [Promethearchaeota archaeon]|nr:MAG: hypothetical protein EU539_00860 [Candidatus Lokiarchaeota archaeon]